MAFRLDLNLVQIQVVVQELTFAVLLVSFLVDWPVGTVFIAVAFLSFKRKQAAGFFLEIPAGCCFSSPGGPRL